VVISNRSFLSRNSPSSNRNAIFQFFNLHLVYGVLVAFSLFVNARVSKRANFSSPSEKVTTVDRWKSSMWFPIDSYEAIDIHALW
jgi:hypothetical protein